jgi:TolB protein
VRVGDWTSLAAGVRFRPHTPRKLALVALAGLAGVAGAVAALALRADDDARVSGKIVFSYGAEGNDDPARAEEDLYVARADGTGKRRLTTALGAQFDPSWSPDGRRIAYRNFDDDIYVVDAGGANARNLTRSGAHDLSPDWSSDGRTIAFSSNRSGKGEIWLMDADGGNPRSLGVEGEYPSWSPDGGRLAYSSYSGPTDWGISIVDVDGGQAHVVLDDYEREYVPAWSPDGSLIAFSQGYDGFRSLWVMRPDGKERRQVTRDHDDFGPTWSPDGRWILFSRDAEALYLVRPGGGGPARVGLSGSLPDWAP